MEGIVAARTRDALSIRDVLFSMDGFRCAGARVFFNPFCAFPERPLPPDRTSFP